MPPPKQSANPDLKPKYSSGEKILCFHGPLLYEAKCLDVKIEDKEVKYFVHYQGWNKHWDEWVLDTRMTKFNEAGLKRQKELEKVFKSGKKKLKALRKSDLQNQIYPPPEVLAEIQKMADMKDSTESDKQLTVKTEPTAPAKKATVKDEAPAAKTQKGSTGSGPPSSSADTSRDTVDTPLVSIPTKRRKTRAPAGDNVETDEGFLRKLHLKMELPEQLKLWLVDDWDLITRQSRLVHLPARVTVQEVLDRYLAWHPEQRAGGEQPKDDLKEEFVQGIVEYFNLVLGSQLLYKFERLQYSDMLRAHTKKKLSDVYSPIHLLRLFVKLREMVSYTKVDARSLPSLESMVLDFLDFVDHNCAELIKLDDFVVATVEYQRRSMC